MRCAHLTPLMVIGALVVSADAQEYEIGPGDVLSVIVLNQPGLTGEFTVDPEGFMVYPFVGRVKAAGLSALEIERKLATLLSDGTVHHASRVAGGLTATVDGLVEQYLGAVEADNAFVMRAGASAWHDLSSRFGVHGSVGYVHHRPIVRTTLDGVTESERWEASRVSVETGLTVGIF